MTEPFPFWANLPVVRPTSVADLGTLVRAVPTGQALYPRGGGTHSHEGRVPTTPGQIVDLTALTQVIDYPARDMTITVQAGLTLAALDAVLRQEQQRLPVDVPLPTRATLGGALSTNASGPRRLGHGTFRDYVIGLSAINDQGAEVKAGGRVVKNVAGYDLCKLLTGAWGTLGILTQLTFKLRPRPELTAVLPIGVTPDQVGPMLEALHASRTGPCVATLVDATTARNCAAVPTSAGVLFVGFEAKAETVAWQLTQLPADLAAVGGVFGTIYRAAEAEQVLAVLADWPLTTPGNLGLKANLLPSELAPWLATLLRTPENRVLAQVGNGSLSLRTTVADVGQAQQLCKRWRVQVPITGNVVVDRCPAEWTPSLPIWGSPRPDVPLMRTIKATLDPQGRLNPGRFVV
jgi:glycolate oxidase FAD binding subunit